MLIVPVKEGEAIDKALKKLKRKQDKVKLVRELRARQYFTKPSVEKRQGKIKAIYKQQLVQQVEA